MTTLSRRERIEAMLVDEPDDLFLQYSLALEWDKEGKNEKSLALLRALAFGAVSYVPAYFMAGQQLARLNRIEEARAILRDGIEAARTQNESHAAGEMSEFLTTLATAGE